MDKDIKNEIEKKEEGQSGQDGKKQYTVSKFSYTIRVFVALYLLYTVWELRRTPFETTGTERIVFIVAIIAFLAFASIIGGTSLRALIKKEYAENDPGFFGKGKDDK